MERSEMKIPGCVEALIYKSSANEEGLFDTFEALGVNGPHLSECTPNTEGWQKGYYGVHE
ncbi:hypothetical protein [Plebeiibacterium sediminum]|uniref:Uncharacterized protein n=1 Tax=Plebeiibacterium sediminum TaxID=2992112 RepID=A0AAE3M9U8_9BACT|nr:hypothetical protein [Plebeiobacterium sediminum]MCW3789597.1 hypothetical protein [Plebeiobacterium sediminum]